MSLCGCWIRVRQGPSVREPQKQRHTVVEYGTLRAQQLPCGQRDGVLWKKRDEVHAQKWASLNFLFIPLLKRSQ